MNTESKQINRQLLLNREQTKAALLSLLTVIMFSFLLLGPQYLPSSVVGLVLGVAPAAYMTWYLHTNPDPLRNRRGSLFTAMCLVAFLWLVAIGAMVAILADVVG